MYKFLAILLITVVVTLTGCPSVGPKPNPNYPDDVPASCDSACTHIGEEGLKCEEGRPTAAGATCQEVCESIPNLSQGYLDCIAAVTICSQISACPR